METTRTEQEAIVTDRDPNPYAVSTRPAAVSSADAGIEELDADDCWRLVEAADIGRLAVRAPDGHPDIYPLNHLVHGGAVFVRSAAGSKLGSIAAHPECAFEVDGVDDEWFWSVVMRGTARRMDTDADIIESGILDLISWSPTAKHDFVRFHPVSMTGRRFPRGREVREDAFAPPATEPGDHHLPRKPKRIPHFAPIAP